MSVQTLQEYNLTYEYMQRLLDKWGQPCTVFIPTSLVPFGYENNEASYIEKLTGVKGIGNTYQRYNTKCHINFTVKKSVFYHFNWFPEDADELCTAVLPQNNVIQKDSFLRTSQPDQVSNWGDLLFRVEDIKDEGIYQTLKRTYFLRPVSSTELKNLFVLGQAGQISIQGSF